MSGVEIAQPLTALTRLLSPKYFREMILTTNEGLVLESLKLQYHISKYVMYKKMALDI